MYALPPKTILAALDFTDRSAGAWRFAVALSEKLGVPVEAAYVSPVGAAKAAAAKLKRAAPGARKVHVLEGDVEFGILKACRDSKADLLIMATEGLSGVRRLKRASKTEAIVRSSEIPVLSVRGDAFLPRSILAPVNLEPYSWAGAKAATALAGPLKSKVLLHHVSSGAPSPAELRRLKTAAENASLEFRHVEGDPVERILEESGHHELVCLVVHRKGLLRDAVLGTTAEQVLRRSSTPVLALPGT